MNRTQQRGDGEGRDDRQAAAEREASEWAADTGFQSGANQQRDEPIPASHHDDQGQGAVVREEEHAHGAGQARPSPRAPSGEEGGHGDRG